MKREGGVTSFELCAYLDRGHGDVGILMGGMFIFWLCSILWSTGISSCCRSPHVLPTFEKKEGHVLLTASGRDTHTHPLNTSPHSFIFFHLQRLLFPPSTKPHLPPPRNRVHTFLSPGGGGGGRGTLFCSRHAKRDAKIPLLLCGHARGVMLHGC